MRKILMVLLAIMLIMVVPGTALKTVDVPVNVTVFKDGIEYRDIQHTNISFTVAEAPPIINLKLFVNRNNSTKMENYVGPYKEGEGIRVTAQAQVSQGCVDDILITAPVYNSTSKQIEIKPVIDTRLYSTAGVCYGPWHTASWDYDTGFPDLSQYMR